MTNIAREQQDLLLRYCLLTYLKTSCVTLELRNYSVTWNNFFRFATEVIVWHENLTLLDYLKRIESVNYYEYLWRGDKTPYCRLRITWEALRTQFVFFEAYESTNDNLLEITRPLLKPKFKNIEQSIFNITKKEKSEPTLCQQLSFQLGRLNYLVGIFFLKKLKN